MEKENPDEEEKEFNLEDAPLTSIDSSDQDVIDGVILNSKEARKHDSLMRQLKSARGVVEVSNLVRLQPELIDQDACFGRLERMFIDDLLDCDTEELTMDSKIKINDEGNEFLYQGGYSRLRRKMIRELTEETKEPIGQYLIPVSIFVALIGLLYLLLVIVWKA